MLTDLFLCWLTYLYMYLKSKKQCFIYQGWLLHCIRKHHSNILFSAIGPLDLYCFSFKSAPKTPSYLGNMSGFQCASLCMVPDLKANAQLLLLALPCSSSVLQMSAILTEKKELQVNNFQSFYKVFTNLRRKCYCTFVAVVMQGKVDWDKESIKSFSGGEIRRECFDNSIFLLLVVLKERKKIISQSSWGWHFFSSQRRNTCRQQLSFISETLSFLWPLCISLLRYLLIYHNPNSLYSGSQSCSEEKAGHYQSDENISYGSQRAGTQVFYTMKSTKLQKDLHLFSSLVLLSNMESSN